MAYEHNFKVGDRVQKIKYNVSDSGRIVTGRTGTIIQVQDEKIHHYLVHWDYYQGDHEFNWWINEKCLAPEVTLTKHEKILIKIKYLDKRFQERKHAANVRL